MSQWKRSALAGTRYTTCALALVLAGCGPDLVSPRPVDRPLAEIQDASHNNGNAHFFFASPIARDPAPTGAFNAAAQPVVSVCEWTSSGCGPVVAEFAVGRGTGGSTVKVDRGAERYVVNWNTGQCRSGACVLDPAKTYRIRVLVGGIEAGYADIDVVSTQAQARNVNTGEYIALVEGKLLPIRFRIEDGLSLTSPLASADGVYPNSRRYKDDGAHPATGRSGSAALEARALLGRDGSTIFELTTGSLDAASAPPGNIDHVQFKLLAPDDNVILARNYTGLSGGGAWTRTYTALGRNQAFQLQANVSGIDGNRTDVVTVQGAVQLRPDLAALAINAPSQVAPNVTVPVSATVSERNGDVGATANCVLYVNGVEADRADGIWVDAGRSVNCQLTATFTRSGTSTATVAVEGVVPGDDDPANNSISATVTVAEPLPFYFGANAYELDYRGGNFKTTYDSRATSNDNTLDYTYHDERFDQSRIQYANLWASRNAALEFPIAHIEATQSSGGSLLNRMAYDNVPADYAATYSYDDPWSGRTSVSYTPIWRSIATPNGMFYLYLESGTRTWSGGNGQPAGTNSYTQLSSQRNTGDVSYYGHTSYSYNDTRRNYQNSYSYNYERNYSLGALSKLDVQYVITAGVTGAGEGAASYTMTAPITSFSKYTQTYDGTQYCWDSPYSDELSRIINQHYCYAYSGSYSMTYGYFSGTSTDAP